MLNILILHCYQSEFPLRATTKDWLYSFQRYSGHRCFYLNLFCSGIPWYVSRIKWDLIIFTDLFVVGRWHPKTFKKILKKAQPIKKILAPKILIPQDEFIYTNELCDLINEFNIEFVFTCAQEPDWKKIYSSVDFNKVKFATVLTGYLDENTLQRINHLAEKWNERIFDIGYRSKRVSPSLGRLGLLKSKIADIVIAHTQEHNLITNISLDPRDTFLGDSWYQFLLQCKYFLGVEGGSSILDRDGTLQTNVENYLKKHPTVSFEEVESECFPNRDGNLHLFAISPRHLEACATKTCQILIEGEYNGILIPGKHYIELKKDFSNIEEVLDIVKQDTLRVTITNNAYHDIVESGMYTYRNFVKIILDNSINDLAIKSQSKNTHLDEFAYQYSCIIESMSWIIVAIRWIMVKHIFFKLPQNFIKFIIRRYD